MKKYIVCFIEDHNGELQYVVKEVSDFEASTIMETIVDEGYFLDEVAFVFTVEGNNKPKEYDFDKE